MYAKITTWPSLASIREAFEGDCDSSLDLPFNRKAINSV